METIIEKVMEKVMETMQEPQSNLEEKDNPSILKDYFSKEQTYSLSHE